MSQFKIINISSVPNNIVEDQLVGQCWNVLDVCLGLCEMKM